MLNYFDLIKENLETLSIVQSDNFNCILKDNKESIYDWFLLSMSDSWKAYTICDVWFHKSSDWKFKPRLIFKRTNSNLQDKTVWKQIEFQRISFNTSGDWCNEFWKMIRFLNKFKDIVDVWDFENNYFISSSWDITLSDLNNINTWDLQNILSSWTLNSDFLKTILEQWVTDQDVVWLWYRKKQLYIFEKLLNDQGYMDIYRTEEDSLNNNSTEEKVFQYFFHKNSRIFWYGLDYRYLSILQREATVWSPNTGWNQQELLDFLAWCRDYTILIEIKKPSTVIFSWSVNRSWSWCLSSDFIWAISQILEYKASAQLFLENYNNKINSQWDHFNHYTLDPKSILIIGRRSMLNWVNDLETKLKKRTFELFKRDSRNIDILTYDDIFDRAKFIIES